MNTQSCGSTVTAALSKKVTLPTHQSFPDVGFLRVKQILGDSKQGIPAIIPVSASTWYAGVKSGRFPKGGNLMGGRITLWRVEDIRALVESLSAVSPQKTPSLRGK